jgi:dTDP-glucose pyrophosphorylase
LVVFYKDIKEIIVDKDYSIRETIKILEKTNYKIVLVINNKNQLEGIVTDGDIRSSLLKDFNLDFKVVKIMNKKPKVVYENSNHLLKSHNLINKKKFIHVPLISPKRKVLGIYMIDLLNTKKINDVAFFIMAGGKGERLKPITDKIPKPMINISGKPIMEYIIDKAKIEGFEDIFISVNHLSKVIKNYFKGGIDRDLKIKYIEEKKPLGTIGSLTLFNHTNFSNILITNADVYTNISYKDILAFHNENKSDLTVVVKEYYNEIPYGVVSLKGKKLLKIKEKPSSFEYINTGIYVLNSSIINLIPKNKKFDATEYIKKLLSLNKNVNCYLSYEKWTDIGTKKELDKLKIEFGKNVLK